MKEKNLNFDEVINRKNTDCLKYDFAARRGKPEDVLPLWVADVDFKTSSIVLDEIHRRVDHGIFGYTETRDKYFESVFGWLKKLQYGYKTKLAGENSRSGICPCDGG